ncbi:PX domain-containing protein kinase-like protein isoform X1 [Stomoxys calcitrans]|uniref:PX domain-containing protein kinase-like protein isoform X1 n=2 Tax=Stomoxys calcitrans TaxID=35570 RepID=UPI0027E2F434|nr:PX domain-containing protein kinase-like protein isoform X1 [Stomoxys calcitrans]
MDIFEKRFGQQHTRYIQDDTATVNCVIETAQQVNGHTEYLLRLERGYVKQYSWKILRRYNDFAELQKHLSISEIDLPFPGKKLFGNMRPDFIAERRKALQLYINTVLMNPILASSLPAKRFVDPDSYSQSFHDQAVQNALLCLRSEGLWSLGSTLGAIGWRLRKHYFKVTQKPPDTKSSSKSLVKSGSQTHAQIKQSSVTGADQLLDASASSELVLEWLEYGPDKYIDDKELGGILKSLVGLQHPNIEALHYAMHNENGCLVIRKFHKHGTLKDILCMATPKNPFLSKYGNPKGRMALSMKQVAVYGKQILEVLIFLHSKGYPYGHLHSGNIVIIDDCVKLLDIENYVLGVPSFYRPFFVQHGKIYKSEAIDVYCFGHILFEMAMGYPMQESIVRQITDCPEILKNLLESILSKEACKTGLPSLEQLLAHDFFKQYSPSEICTKPLNDESQKPHLKLSLNAKEAIKQAILKTENRLREEQKSVKNQKRIVRVQELMSSEEEKRKSKHKAKQEYKQSKLKQQGSLQNNNGRLALSAVGATGSVTESSEISPRSLNRMNSVITNNTSQDAMQDLKSPPPTPAAYQSSNEAETRQTIRHHTQQSINEMSPPGAASSVDRQSSSPNITSDEQVSAETEIERSALLESICKFNRGSLRKVRSND